MHPEQPDLAITVGGKRHQILFSMNAQYQLDMHLANTEAGTWFARIPAKRGDKDVTLLIERATGDPFEYKGDVIVPEYRRPDLPSLLARFQRGEAAMRDIQLFLWAALEGGRRKHHPDSEPITIEKAGDLIDDAGGIATIAPALIKAMLAASPASSSAPKKRAARRKK